MLGFKLEENWALSTLWVWVSAKIPAQAAHWEVLEVWPGPAELGVGTEAELRPCCASLCFTLALPLLGGGSAVWRPEQGNSASGLCLWLSRGGGASQGAEPGSASPGAQNTNTLGFHFPPRTQPAPTRHLEVAPLDLAG